MKEQFDLMGESYEDSLREFPDVRLMDKNHVLNIAQVRENMSVLDFAAGTGYLSLPIAAKMGQAGSVTAVDISSVMLNQLKQKAEAANLLSKIQLVHTSDPNLSELKDDTFDCAVSLGGFHHVKNQVEICQSIYRLLKPSGKAILMDFEDNTPVQVHFDTLVHENNPTGQHLALFLSVSRARNLAHYAGCKNPKIEQLEFAWGFKSADALGHFFCTHHGLKCSEATARDIALETFNPEIRRDGSLEILVNYISLILEKAQ
jgi:ubiquinone/menaquinone biosynthesis C-methylase UbiE